MLTLHCFCQSGNSYKVALALQAMKLPWQPLEVDFMNGKTRDPVWRAETNVMGEAPVLEMAGKRISQSGLILTKVARVSGKFAGHTEDERDEVLRWILFDNHKFTSYLATYRFMKSFGPAAPDPAVLSFLKTRIDAAFGVVEKHLSQSNFIVGDALTIADFSLCGYLYYPKEETGIDIAATYPHMQAWLNRIRNVDGWADPYALMPGARIAPKWA